ncbi:hypothetical protein ACFOET_17315 [Parapedobacter deserti]|uniref:Uncharacterized protein n=1 Tax=Parapedobacter deserti TaxID=1912957 RepID=A0ABV7JMT8_9SPHI
MKKLLVLLIGLSGWGGEVRAQSSDRQTIIALQDSLVKLGGLMYNEPSEPERLKANFTFIKTFVSALKQPHSYSFPFDSLNMVSKLSAPDDRFRIFSWHIQLNDGSYLYYGTIQMNSPDGTLSMHALLDKTYEIESPETAITTASNWYGAQYYRIIPFKGDYLLLGWKGHTPHMTQKVIEVLQVSTAGVRMGKTVFDSENSRRNARMIYRYNRNASMYMEYDPAENRIVLDHLAPSDERYKGHYEEYGPDLTYDAWALKNGRLIHATDIQLLNLPDPNDNLYNDPHKPLDHPKSGIPIQ